MSESPASTQPTRDREHSAPLDVEGNASSNNGSFFVHSNKTLTTALPPKVDNKVLSRQKRRRTSPEDHAVLEAEYQRNPKPDKITRANIVSRVSLGDKEVQIWFQNRRQNDRRRSKPLQPHEFLPPANSVVNPRISDERSTANAGRPQTTAAEQDRPIPSSFSKPALSPNTSFKSSTDSECNGACGFSQLDSSQTTVVSESSECRGSTMNSDGKLLSNEASLLAAPVASSGGKRKRSDSDLLGVYRAERRQTTTTASTNFVPPSLRVSLSFDGEAIVKNEDEKTPSPPKVRDPVRVSFSADGEAVIRTANEPSPLKSRQPTQFAQQSRSGTLRRCHSAVTLGTSGGVSSLREKLFGRSRDSRAWESYCDTDARSAMSPNNNTGSVSSSQTLEPRKPLLTRRKSESGNTNPLSPLPSMSNNALLPPSEPRPEKRTKLSRTVSSLGRLESESRRSASLPGTKKGAIKDNAKNIPVYEDGDSDKENWIPGTRVSGTRRRGPKNRRRPAAQPLGPMSADARRGAGNASVLSTSKRPNGVRSRPPPSDIKTERYLSEVGDGVDPEPETASQVEDLDCIQGLLSLSQGAWG